MSTDMADPAAEFTAMAARLARIDAEEFAGAVVIVPPGEGEPITFMLTDPNPKPAQFWSGLSARVEIAGAEAQQAEQDARGGGYGGRR